MLPGRSYFYLSESADYERDQDRESPEQDQLSTTQVDDQELSLYSGEGPSSLAAAGLAKGQACSQCRAGKRVSDPYTPIYRADKSRSEMRWSPAGLWQVQEAKAGLHL